MWSGLSMDALHIFAKNINASGQNYWMLQTILGDFHTITAINHLPKKNWNHKINEILNRIHCETAGLTQVLEITAEARGMLTVNIDLKDRLVVNGQLGTVKYISQGSINSVIKIYFTLSWTEKDEHW